MSNTAQPECQNLQKIGQIVALETGKDDVYVLFSLLVVPEYS